jgi:hypothetical protein
VEGEKGWWRLKRLVWCATWISEVMEGDVRQFEDEMMFLPLIIALYRAVETTRVGIHLFTVSQTDNQSL